jgi:hypothetical protein
MSSMHPAPAAILEWRSLHASTADRATPLCFCMRTQTSALTNHIFSRTQIKDTERTTPKPLCCRQTGRLETTPDDCARGALKL